MKCPYNRRSETHITDWMQKNDEQGNPVGGATMEHYEFEMTECLKDNCSAFHSGRCCYASVNFSFSHN